ncbi:hypothetical protein TNCV_4173901 [Trichonephila clavipes]|nr:hypothetical protein TNCV_4173901 [Trichonephila clavipes]
MPKSNAQRGKAFRERKEKKEKKIQQQVHSQKSDEKQSTNSSNATAKSPSKYIREYRAREKTLQNTLLMPGLRDWNAIKTLLMTAQINTDF